MARFRGTIGLSFAIVVVASACASAPPAPTAVEPPPTAPNLPPAESASRRLALAIEVADAPRAEADLVAFLHGAGGTITSRDAPVLAEGTSRSILLAISCDSGLADGLLAKIRALGTVVGERSQAEDAIPDLVEINAKLAGLREVESRLRLWMDGSQHECAAVEGTVKERSRVVDEIAGLVARQRLQNQRTQNTALAVRLYEKARPLPPAATFAADLRRAAIRIVSDPCASARDGAITLLAWLPAIVVIGLLAAWISRRRRRP